MVPSASSFAALKRLHHHVGVGVDANLGRDRHRLAGDLLRAKIGVKEGPGGGQREVAARADAGHSALRLQHVAGAGKNQRHLPVGDDHHGLEPPQVAVGAPVLGEFHTGAGELGRILLQLVFQPLEQGEGVGGGAGEAADHVALAERAHLPGVGLDDRRPEAHLAVAGDDDRAGLAHRQDGGAVPNLGGSCLGDHGSFLCDVGIEGASVKSEPCEPAGCGILVVVLTGLPSTGSGYEAPACVCSDRFDLLTFFSESNLASARSQSSQSCSV